MCGTTSNGYKQIDGNIVNITPYLKLDDLPDKVKKELEATPASQLDCLVFRIGLSENKAESRKVKSIAIGNRDAIRELNNKFHVKVPNGGGEPVDKHISDLILEMYQRETGRRHFSYLKDLISRHKKLVVVLLVTFILTNVVFHNQVRDVFRWIGINIFDLLKIIF